MTERTNQSFKESLDNMSAEEFRNIYGPDDETLGYQLQNAIKNIEKPGFHTFYTKLKQALDWKNNESYVNPNARTSLNILDSLMAIAPGGEKSGYAPRTFRGGPDIPSGLGELAESITHGLAMPSSEGYSQDPGPTESELLKLINVANLQTAYNTPGYEGKAMDPYGDMASVGQPAAHENIDAEMQKNTLMEYILRMFK